MNKHTATAPRAKAGTSALAKLGAKAGALLTVFALTLSGCGTKTSMDIDYDVDDYVTLGQYEGLEVTIDNYEVTEEKIRAAEEEMISSTVPYIKSDETVVSADSIVNVDYVGKKDGVAFDGGTASSVNIDVAGNADADQGTGYIDGFTSALVGATVGTTVDADVTFPENYSSTDLAGQQVVFTFTINYVETAVTLDNITDEIVAQNFSDYKTVDDLYNGAKAQAEESAESSKTSATRAAVIEAVKETCKVNSFPEGLVEKRLEEYEQKYTDTYVTDGSTLEEYLSSTYGTTLEDFESQIKESLESNLTVEMIFEAIAKKEGIELDEDGYNEYTENLVTQAGVNEVADLFSIYGPNDAAGEEYLKKMYVCNKACDLCVDQAKVSVSAEDEG